MRWVDVPKPIITIRDECFHEDGESLALEYIEKVLIHSNHTWVILYLNNGSCDYVYQYNTPEQAKEAAAEIMQAWEEWKEKR